MRILVVNAYSYSPEGKRKYHEFFETLMNSISEQNENLEGRNHHIIERDKDSLQDFLFDNNTNYYKKESGHNFDLLDLVCVVGDTSLLPWMNAAQKVLILIKMCLRVKKWLFASGFGMHALVYLSASNFEKHINVINGKERGGKIVEISKINIGNLPRNQSEHFLDHVTGDVYSLNHERDEWIPATNVGLHYKRAALEFNSIGKYVVKSPVYVPKRINGNDVVCDMNEVVCMVKKHISGHWLFQGCDTDFIVCCDSKWQVHTFTFLDKSKVFKELAASNDGPMIIEFQNIIAVQFDIKKRYSSSVVIFKNFISAKLRRLVEDAQVCSIIDYRGSRSDSGPSELFFKPKHKISDYLNDKLAARKTRGFRLSGESIPGLENQKMGLLNQKLGNLFEVTNSNGMFIPPEIDLTPFKHSGFASKQKGPMIAERNNIRNHRIAAKKTPLKDESFAFRISSIQEKFRQQFLQKDDTSLDKSRLKSPQKANSVNHSTNVSPPLLIETSDHAMNLNAKQTRPITSDSSISFNKSEIRRALYPQLDEDFVKNLTAWVPGNLSAQKKMESKKNVIRVTDDMYRTGIFFKKRHKFGDSSPESGSHQSIRISSPYQSQGDLLAIDRKENDKRVLHGVFFYNSSNSQQTQNIRPSTVSQSRQQMNRKASAPNMKASVM